MSDQEDQGQEPSDSAAPPSRPPAYNGPFLFVNKNAQNLRSRQKDEVFAVRSHAMQIARRSRKPSTTATDASKSSTQPGVEGSGRTQTPGQASASQPSGSQRTQRQERPVASRGLSSRTGKSRMSPAPETRRRTTDPLQTVLDPLPAQYLAAIVQHVMGSAPPTATGGGASDPFSAAAVPISAFFNSILQYWRVGSMSNFWPPAVYLNPSHEVPQLFDSWIRNTVISSPAMLHGIFAETLSFIANHQPTTAATPVLWARGMHHHGKCLEFTRARLAMPGVSSEEALAMIHQSTTFSFYCGDFDASSVHRVASARILNTLGQGLESVHPVLKSLLVHCDTLTAIHKPKRPSLDVESWAPPSWHDEETLRPFDDVFDFDPSEYAQSDRSLLVFTEPVYGKDSEDLTIQVQGMVNLQREALCANDIAARITLNEGVANADPIYSWLALRQYALTCRSASLYMAMVDSEPEPHTVSLAIQLRQVLPSCILLAASDTFQLIMHCSKSSASTGYIPFHHLRSRLTFMMTLMGEARRLPAEDTISVPTETLLFLFFAGAVAEEIEGPAPRAQSHQSGPFTNPVPPGSTANVLHMRWFSVHFSMVLQRLGVNDWITAREVLEKFIYDERTMDGYLQSLVRKRSEFLGVLAGVGVTRVSGNHPGGGDTQVATAGLFAGQTSAPVAGSFPAGFPMTTADYEQEDSSVPQVSALTPITGQEFAAGFWEHMGLSMDLDVGVEALEQVDLGAEGQDLEFNEL